MRSPLWVEPAYLCTYSIVMKALTWPVLRFKFLRDGVTRSERRFSFGFVWICVPSRWGLPFRVECPYLCMSSIGWKDLTCLFWVSSSFAIGSPCRVVYPFFLRTRSVHRNFLLLAAAPLPCLPHGTCSGLSPSGLIHCYALSSSFVDFGPLVVHPSVVCP